MLKSMLPCWTLDLPQHRLVSRWSLDVIKEHVLCVTVPSLLLHLFRILCFSPFLWTASCARLHRCADAGA